MHLHERCRLRCPSSSHLPTPAHTLLLPPLQYLFTILWPSRWAPKGYSSLTLGHEDLETARAWHQLAEQSIAYVRRRYQVRGAYGLEVMALEELMSTGIQRGRSLGGWKGWGGGLGVRYLCTSWQSA